MVVSALVHTTLAGTLYYWFVLYQPDSPAPIVAELDLSMASLVPIAHHSGGSASRSPTAKAWTVPQKEIAPIPQVVETKQEVAAEELQEEPREVESQTNAPPCPQPCPQNQTGSGGTEGGAGEDPYLPASLAFRKPQWIQNFITASDYPLLARRQGNDGLVVLTVWIDAEGRVRDVRLLQGSYEALNEVALRKLPEAIFTPAYDEKNRPVASKVTLPIRFTLR